MSSRIHTHTVLFLKQIRAGNIQYFINVTSYWSKALSVNTNSTSTSISWAKTTKNWNKKTQKSPLFASYIPHHHNPLTTQQSDSFLEHNRGAEGIKIILKLMKWKGTPLRSYKSPVMRRGILGQTNPDHWVLCRSKLTTTSTVCTVIQNIYLHVIFFLSIKHFIT